MDITKIVEMQKTLDNRIYNKFGLVESETFAKRKLALIVELSELANEVRCFKFWSVKPSSAKAVILEEYVDCLHFIVSLGITINADFAKIDFAKHEQVESLTEQFVKTISMTSNLTLDNTDLYYQLFTEINTLSYNLGFTLDEVLEAYNAKNEVNHQRQSNNY